MINKEPLLKKYVREFGFEATADVFDIIVLCSYEELAERNELSNPNNLSFLKKYVIDNEPETNIDLIRNDVQSLSYMGIVNLLTESIDVLRNSSQFNHLEIDSGKILYGIINDLLEFKDGDTFVDFGSGYGFVLLDECVKTASDGKCLKVFAGIEQDPVKGNVCQALFEILFPGIPQNICIGDMFTESMDRYLKGYIYPPLKTDTREQNKKSTISSLNDVSKTSKLNQWDYVNQLLSHIDFENGGRAIALLNSKSLSETKNNEYLQHLLRKGRIEAVIKLPKILSNTYTTPFLVVFSNHNEKVKIMDASSDAFLPQDKKFSPDYSKRFYYDKLIQFYKDEDNDYLKELDLNSLAKFNNWDPTLIFSLLKSNAESSVPLVDFLDDMFIGLQVHAANFKQEEGGDYKAISVGDINGNYGEIDFDNLKTFDEGDFGKFVKRRYKLKKGDVLITTKSSVNKITIIEEDPPEPIVPIGGIIVLRPDLNRLNPTYLKMYLESEEGQKMLKDSSVSSGAVFIISLRNFRENMYIRPIPIEGQNEKVEKYNNLIKQLRQKRQEVEALDASLKEIYKE